MTLSKKLILIPLFLVILASFSLLVTKPAFATTCTSIDSRVFSHSASGDCGAAQDAAVNDCRLQYSSCQITNQSGTAVTRGASCGTIPGGAGTGLTGYSASIKTWFCAGSCGTTSGSCGLAAPTNLKMAYQYNGCPSYIQLKWDVTSGATYYILTLNGTTKNVGSSTNPNYIINPSESGKIYSWNVKACNSVSCSGASTGPSVVAKTCSSSTVPITCKSCGDLKICGGTVGGTVRGSASCPTINCASNSCNSGYSCSATNKVCVANSTTTNCQTAGNCPNGSRCTTNSQCSSRICLSTPPYGSFCSASNGSGSGGDCKNNDIIFDPTAPNIKAGATQTVKVKVKNNNSKTCTYSLSADVTGKWTADLNGNVAVEAGKTSDPKTLTVKAPANASERKTVNVHAGNKTTQYLTFTVTGGGDGKPTDVPTPTHQRNGTNTPTPTGHRGNPTSTPTPTPSGGGNGNTKLAVTLGIDGMGTTPKISIGGNQNPLVGYSSRPLTFKIYNTSNNSLALSTDQSVNYDNSDKKFHATFSLPNSFTTGSYNLYAEGLPYVVSRIPGSINITKGQTNPANSSNFYMITGNINDKDQSENKVDLLDYNVMISCWIYSTNNNACDQDDNYISNSDLNGDGQVDQDDYTLLLKEMGSQGAATPDQ